MAFENNGILHLKLVFAPGGKSTQETMRAIARSFEARLRKSTELTLEGLWITMDFDEGKIVKGVGCCLHLFEYFKDPTRLSLKGADAVVIAAQECETINTEISSELNEMGYKSGEIVLCNDFKSALDKIFSNGPFILKVENEFVKSMNPLV